MFYPQAVETVYLAIIDICPRSTVVEHVDYPWIVGESSVDNLFLIARGR